MYTYRGMQPWTLSSFAIAAQRQTVVKTPSLKKGFFDSKPAPASSKKEKGSRHLLVRRPLSMLACASTVRSTSLYECHDRVAPLKMEGVTVQNRWRCLKERRTSYMATSHRYQTFFVWSLMKKKKSTKRCAWNTKLSQDLITKQFVVAKLRNFELTVSFLSASFYTNSLKGTLGAILVEFKWICWATIHRKINAPLNDQAYTHSHSHTHTHTHTTHTHTNTHTHTHTHTPWILDASTFLTNCCHTCTAHHRSGEKCWTHWNPLQTWWARFNKTQAY